MPSGTPYTDDQRAQALAIFETEGATVAARTIGCTPRTIYNWAEAAGASRAFDQTRAAAESNAMWSELIRLDLRAALIDKIGQLLEAVDPADPQGAKHLMTAFAIGLDKYRLEMGEHTSHTRTEGTDDVDRAVSQLVGEHERRSQTAGT